MLLEWRRGVRANHFAFLPRPACS